MATIVKQEFSASTDGRPIEVGDSNTTIHETQAATGDNNYDEIWAWATNTSTSAVVLTVLWGGTTDADDKIIVTIPPREGLMQIIPGLVLQNGCDFLAVAAVNDVINIVGFVNKITA
jgi:hypothetical protein